MKTLRERIERLESLLESNENKMQLTWSWGNENDEYGGGKWRFFKSGFPGNQDNERGFGVDSAIDIASKFNKQNSLKKLIKEVESDNDHGVGGTFDLN